MPSNQITEKEQNGENKTKEQNGMYIGVYKNAAEIATWELIIMHSEDQ